MPALKSLFTSLLLTLALFIGVSLLTLFLGAFDNPIVSVVGFLVVWGMLFGLFEA